MIFLRKLIPEAKSSLPTISRHGNIDLDDPSEVEKISKIRSKYPEASPQDRGPRGFELIIYRPVGGNNGKGNWLTGKYDEVFGYSKEIDGNIVLDREKLKRTLVITAHSVSRFADIAIAVPYVLFITGEWSNVVAFSGNFVWTNDARYKKLNNGHPITCHDLTSR